MGIIEQLYLATDTIHGVYHKTHKVVNTINGNSKVILSISINLLAFYHECRSLIGYATHVLFGDR